MQTTISNHEGWTDASPKEVGYNPKTLDRLDAHYMDLISKGTIQAASYMLSRKGKIFANRSLGKLLPDENSPDLEPDSLRKVYSITKAFTAVAVLQLIDRGKLALHQSVSSILPEFNTDMHRGITIFHLLTHTSGLQGDPGFHMEPYSLPWYEWAVREMKTQNSGIGWITMLLAGPVHNKPGKEWIYNSSGFVLLGEVIAKVSGKSYDEYIRDEITQPLGMNRTFMQVPEEFRSQVCCTNEWELEQVLNPKAVDADFPPRAGNGLYSTLEDLTRFGQMMLNGGEAGGSRIISTRAVGLHTTNQLSGVVNNGWGGRQTDYQFGLGWSLDHFDLCSKGTFSHEGYGPSGLYVDPAEELIFTFFVPSAKGFRNESVVTPRAIAWSGLL
ncbi:serine hydrolase domain-containing protein [Paenibacillus radicis (ex Gao et al. 2016)]|uniref:Serine hydrolase n=1 Tax=Paenibacillus radicis (ex Gao et al. 2016) TaxID=1737354 RepID=A0A917HB84_9BACL|nr:serine hydrolase domain-containing protein [Paenibacillus radicis (ex Gao et al. 2016)]GGG74020.1 serine hydrolase [Paenibacillus radicis (ex Gao et al. 2016)]